MDLQALLNSRKAAEWVLSICQKTPPGIAVGLTKLVARVIAGSRATPAVQAVRANQRVVHGGTQDQELLNQAALECWQFITLGFYELYHWFGRPNELQSRVSFPAAFEEIIQNSREKRQGQVLCGVHLASFDIVAQAAYLHGLQAIVLSVPSPNETIQWQHTLRRAVGMEIMDANVGSIRASIRRLEQGESLLTGIDRPMPGLKHKVSFYDRLTYLPTHHISLALAANVPVRVLGPVRLPDGSFDLVTSEPIHMKAYSDRERQVVANTERVLEAVQSVIGLAPTQWGMTHPVWPQELAS